MRLNASPLGDGIVPASSGDSLLAALKFSTDVLRKEGVPYVLIGAWALAVWGRPRATMDLDLLLLVNETELRRIGTRMEQAGMTVDEEWLDSNPLLKGSLLRLRRHGVTIDLLRPRDLHDRQVFRRRRRKRLDRRFYWVVAAEDFILQKLKVGRPRDFEDALSVMKRSAPILDRAYLRRWARRLGIASELDYLLSL